MRNILLACVLVLTLAAASSAQVANKKLGAQSFVGEVTINASPQTVWAVLTDVAKLSKAMGFEYSGAAKFAKVGDHAQVKIWGDNCGLTLIYAKPAAELRFAIDPENASYICQERWLLTPAGSGTKLSLDERYTESGPQTAEDIAAQVKSFNEALARLKAACEGK